MRQSSDKFGMALQIRSMDVIVTMPSTSTIRPSNLPRPPNGVRDHPPIASLIFGQSSRVDRIGNGSMVRGSGRVLGK